MFELAVSFAVLVISIGGLVYFADKVIDHAVRLAHILGISGAVIGMTLLAYGTSLPEFAVSMISSSIMHGNLAVSNVVGSNISNIALVIGIAAVFMPLAFRKEKFMTDGIFMMLATMLLILLAFFGGISQAAGIVMVLIIAGFTYYILKTAGRESRFKKFIKKAARHIQAIRRKAATAEHEFLMAFLYLIGVGVSGYFVVNSAIDVARLLGVTEWVIGASIVAVGTSLPEIVVSLVSAKKKQLGMSIGNIVGSNCFNILLVLGASAAAGPLVLDIAGIWIDLVFLAVLTSLFFIALLRRNVSRPEGILYLIIYALFLLHLLRFF